jgi:N-acylneuraminate cytidylyltransferase
MEICAIIPARGGSKGIPRKNLVTLDGLPLVAHSIQHGLESNLINRVIVSTDDGEIANAALKYGAEVPFMRPSEYAQDYTPDYYAFRHALEWLKDTENYFPDIIVHLRPTSPIRPKGVVDDAIKSFVKYEGADSLRAVCLTTITPYKMWNIKGGLLEPLLEFDTANIDKKNKSEPYNMARQLLPKVYRQNTAIDIFWRKTVINKKSLTGDKILPYIMDEEIASDIDNEIDLLITEIILKRLNK